MTQRAIDGPYIYFVTTNTTFWRKFFVSSQHAEFLGRTIQNGCRLKHFDVYGYAILPDHIHMLVRNRNINESGQRLHRYTLSDLMHTVKRNQSRQLNLGRLWKPRFNFRIIEDERRFINTINYMQYNWQKHGHDARYSRSPFIFFDWPFIDEALGSR